MAVWILVLTALEALAKCLLPFAAALFVDLWIVKKTIASPLLIFGVFCVAVGFVTCAGILRDSLGAKFGARALRALRQNLFERVQKLSFTPEEVPDLTAVEWAWEQGIGVGMPAILESLVCHIIIFWVDWHAGLFGLLFWPWVLFSSRGIARRATAAADARHTEEIHTIRAMEELLAARPAIRAFSLEQMTAGSFRKRNNALARKGSKAVFLSAFEIRFTLFGTLLLVAALACSFWLFPQRRITPGIVTALTLLLLLLLHSLSVLSQYLPVLTAGRAAFAKLNDDLEDPDAVLDHEGAGRMGPLRGELMFSDVQVSMPHQEASEETALLSGITARIGQGSYVAFTGPVRAGKSTLLNLLMRFRDPSAGAVYADNADLRTVTQASLREQIGIVQQESFIFNATIRENIRLGRTDASEEALADAAKQAGLYDLIVAMPRGFDTLAGTNGVNLSSGMAQRLAIARAMIRNPSILLLDEVVSPVGPAEEVALLKTIRGLARGRTVISVSHRLTAIKDAEHIYVLEHGRIVEQGSHAELLALAGFYARMWDKQSGFRFLADGVNVEAGHVKVDPSRLRLVPVLADLSGAELADLAIHFATETFPEGREIVHQDHPAEKLFILVRGEAERWHTQEEAVLLEEGDCFGDEAFTPGSSVVETVTALTACTCISLHRCYYEQIMARV